MQGMQAHIPVMVKLVCTSATYSINFIEHDIVTSSLSIIKLKFVILIGAQRSEESPFER